MACKTKKAPKQSGGLGVWSPSARCRRPFELACCDPSAKPCSTGDKERDKALLLQLTQEIGALQDLFFVDRRFALLVILQGMDTSGKDGAIRAVFKETSPLGVRAVGWSAPTVTEQAHDYLWRIHAQMPRRGEFVIFNRSHYEDVLVPVVKRQIDLPTTRARYAQINDFERMLTENGTVILKFMLHISADEQRARLQARLDDPGKHWKFSPDDLSARKQWPRYQRAYENLLRATSSRWAPWVVVPANSKLHRSIMIATLVRDSLRSLKLRRPPGNPELKGRIVK